MRTMQQIKLSNPTVCDLRTDIEQRRMLIGTMVGTIYPAVLKDEILRLKEMAEALQYDCCTHEFYTDKDFNVREVLSRNILWVAVVQNGRKICKRCGYKEAL